MKSEKKFFFTKEDMPVKELLKREEMNLIVGGVEDYKRKVYYERAVVYTESTYVRA